MGIVNGTTNYILTQTNYGKDYETALAEATELGFAESDPTLDVDAYDSKFKLLLLIKHAFGLTLEPTQIFNYGIRNIKPQDVNYASEKGYRLKLFSRGEKIGNSIHGFVSPHFITEENVAYNVNNEFNSVTVEALFSDKQLFQGKGAGAYPTASAVLSDISALQFDYSYEYKKSHTVDSLEFSNDIELKIYAGSSSIENLEIFQWIEKEETFQGKEYAYITGKINLKNCIGIDFNKKHDVFFAVLPE